MRLLFQLPAQAVQALRLEKAEEIVYCVPFDIGEDGMYVENSYAVVTRRRFIVLLNGAIVQEYLLSELERLKCEPQVGGGMVIAQRKAEDYEIRCLRVSMRHLSRMSFVVRGAQLFMEGRDKIVESREYEKVCATCGRALPGTRSCPHCEGGSRRFFTLCAPYKKQLALITLLMVAASFFSLLLPEVQKRFIDGSLRDKSGTTADVLRFAITLLVMALCYIAISITRYWRCVSLGAKISMDIRDQMYHKIQDLTLAFIQDRRPGVLMKRMMHDTAEIRRFMEEAFCDMFACLMTMVGTIVLMGIMNWRLMLLSVLFLPIAVSLSMSFRKNIHRRFHMQWEKGDKIHGSLQDVISGMRVVKSFGKEKEESEKFNRNADEFAVVQSRNEVFWATLFPCLTFLMGLGIYAVTYFGGLDVLNGSMTPGTLLQFVSYAGMLYGPLNWMTHLPRRVTQMLKSLERIYDVLDERPLIENRENAVEQDIVGEVVFEQVSFGYKSYEPVLEKINLAVKAGEMIGFVGASGTGKSTMINLIMRLYEVDDGRILIDGTDINALQIEKYHGQIGVVLQETFLFSGTIYNNIRFAKPDASYEEVIAAAKMANAHDFICKTPDGYNTYVGEHGYNLSGGERQRIAIARAILNNPRILILDEATASLDTESEFLIQKALERLTKGRTTFAIAHRLSTLRGADRLVVIDGHRIAEMGTHAELLAQKGIYYRLVTAQLQMQRLREGA